MGIDLGTSGLKVVVISDQLEPLQSSYGAYDIVADGELGAVQSPEVWWQTLLQCLEPINCHDICGVGLSGQMHGLVMIDANGALLSNAFIWSDRRSANQAKRINELLCEMNNPVGNRVASGFLLSSLLWVKENQPALYRQIHKVMLPKDYLRFRLCGQVATDPSDASGTGAYDILQDSWCTPLLERLDINPAIFPPIIPSVGNGQQIDAMLCPRLSGAWLAGGGDHAVQLLGNGIFQTGVMNCNIGTASQLSVTLPKPDNDSMYRTNLFCHVLPELYNMVGATLNGGVVLKWVRNQICPELSYAQMDQLAEDVPCGADGLILLPYLNGERAPHANPALRGILHGLTLNHTRGHIIRAAMEGILLSLREVQDIFVQASIPSMKIIASGNAASSATMLQMQANIFGNDIYICQVGEQAAVGAALLGGLASGVYEDATQIQQLLSGRLQCVATPNAASVRQYTETFQRFRAIYAANQSMF